MSFIERSIETSSWNKPGSKAAERRPARPEAATPGERIAFASRTIARGGELITEGAHQGIFEQFRRLKRPLLQVAFGPLASPGFNVLVVTSPVPGVGKTFVATNLAHTMALEKGFQVLLIDMDSTRHKLTSQLGLDGQPGFYDVINDDGVPLNQAVRDTDVPGLSILPAGIPAPDSLERLHSARCRDIFQQIISSRYYRLVILDSPPLLVGSDGPAVLAYAGQTLLVVEAGVTPKSTIGKAVEMLDRDKPTGLILNRAPRSLLPVPYSMAP